jgi:hypothetical protein
MVEAYLGDNLELLALAVLRLGNGLLEAVDGLGVELLSGGDAQLDLAAVSAHQGSELLADTLEGAETVVLSESGEEVLQDVGLIGTGDLLELLNDLLLVGDGQGGSAEDGVQLGVGLQGLAEAGDGLGSLVESRGLGGGLVL